MPSLPNADEMMKEFLGRDVARPAVLLHTQVSQDLAGMRALAAARSWRAVLQVSLIWVILPISELAASASALMKGLMIAPGMSARI